jgi:hypothetical protein
MKPSQDGEGSSPSSAEDADQELKEKGRSETTDSLVAFLDQAATRVEALTSSEGGSDSAVSAAVAAAAMSESALSAAAASTSAAASSGSSRSSRGRPQGRSHSPSTAFANIKYKNKEGRDAVIAAATEIRDDYEPSVKMLKVLVPTEALEDLVQNPNITRIDRIWESESRAEYHHLSHPRKKGERGDRRGRSDSWNV